MEIKNAKIVGTKLRSEESGVFSFYIILNTAGNTEYRFGSCESATDTAIILDRILEVIGVHYWENLPNKYARIQYNPDRGAVEAIGNLIEEKWFNIREYFADKEG